MIHRLTRTAFFGFVALPGSSQNMSEPLGSAVQKLRAQWHCLRAWRGYRPERHYMRGAQITVPRPIRPQFNN